MPRRIIGDIPEIPAAKATVADERGIGCMLEFISFGFPDGKSYVCKKEKELADAVLARNHTLWPAIVMFPSGLSADMIYAQCTFKYRPDTDHTYKEASGINNFLRKGRLVEFMREYNVASLIVSPQSLADSFYALDEPRIEESLFVIRDGTAIRYRAEPRKAMGSVTVTPKNRVRQLIRRYFRGILSRRNSTGRRTAATSCRATHGVRSHQDAGELPTVQKPARRSG